MSGSSSIPKRTHPRPYRQDTPNAAHSQPAARWKLEAWFVGGAIEIPGCTDTRPACSMIHSGGRAGKNTRVQRADASLYTPFWRSNLQKTLVECSGVYSALQSVVIFTRAGVNDLWLFMVTLQWRFVISDEVWLALQHFGWVLIFVMECKIAFSVLAREDPGAQRGHAPQDG